MWVFVFFTALLGLAVGSFLNVLIYRVPASLSIVRPSSACPHCGAGILKRDNIPVISWLLLGAKCRACGGKVSVRYPLVEAGTAVFFAVVAVEFMPAALDESSVPAAISRWIVLAAYLYLAAVSVALAAIDLDVQRLPDAIVLPSVVVVAVLLGAAGLVAGDWSSLASSAIGAVALFAAYFVLVLVYPGGMGFGDVKLAAILGLALGWIGWGAFAVGAFAPFLLGGVFALVLVVARRAGRKTRIPFGPWMLAGAWIGIFAGEVIFDRYLALFGLG